MPVIEPSMAKNILADPKMTLGFAGGIVAIALVASMGAGSFVSEAEPVAETAPEGPVGMRPQRPASRPSQPTSAWADSGLSDDWSSDGFGSDGDDGGWASEPSSVDPNAEFEEYVPVRRESSGRSARQADNDEPRSQSDSRSSEFGPVRRPGDRRNSGPPQRLPVPPSG